MPENQTFFSSLWVSLWDFRIQVLPKLIIIQRQNARVYMHCSMSITLQWDNLGSILHFSAVFFLLPWMMRQAWVTWHGVELLLQLYWNLMETWPSKTSTQGINFYDSLRIAQCPHYFNRLETNETIKRAMKLLRLWWHVFLCYRGYGVGLGSPMGLLFKQASNYSLRYTNNPQLMQSVCISSLGIF